VVLLIILILFFAGIIPGLYLDRSAITKISSTKDIYTGIKDYTIGTGNGYWYRYTEASKKRTYSVEYDSGAASK
jgi:hypothetical protein